MTQNNFYEWAQQALYIALFKRQNDISIDVGLYTKIQH